MLGARLTVSVSDFVAETPLVSMTLTVKVWLVAEPPTVPVIAPVAGARLSPVGSEPDKIDQVRGKVPPDAVRVWA